MTTPLPQGRRLLRFVASCPGCGCRVPADRLEELATAATPGPWAVSVSGSPLAADRCAEVVTENAEFEDESHRLGDGRTFVSADNEGYGALYVPDATWIATMSPAVAAPLAKWLRSEARTARLDIMGSGDTPVTWRYVADRYGPAIEFAKLIVGEETP